LRYNNWKVHFLVKEAWFAEPMLRPTVLRPVNPRVDPLEQHVDAPAYALYAGERLGSVLPAAALVKQHAATSKDFPPRPQPPGLHSPGNARTGDAAAAGQ
jgi:arylsulfatase